MRQHLFLPAMWLKRPNLRHYITLISLDSAKFRIGFLRAFRAQKKPTRIKVLRAKTRTCATRRADVQQTNQRKSGFERLGSSCQLLKNDEYHQHFAEA
jgi:hypothetical protein